MTYAPVRDTGCPGFKDEQDENRDFITNYQLPITSLN
jgi:hypothetical protein